MVGRINLLDKSTSDRIAAGEVVERPSAAIKELVENAIDAGSTAVSVEIKEGGISYIRITDNGHGINGEDVPKAFLRHATSKIHSGHDLFNISTLGFRGEALPSIAAVSHTEMFTRQADAEWGTHISIKGGEIESVGEYGCTEGTTVIVRDLFFNTPARKKFLKKPSVEGGYVTDVLTRLALAHPAIALKYIRDSKVIFHTPGDGQAASVIRAVYGRETANALNEVSADHGEIKIHGYIGKSQISKGNRSFQTVIVNGRYIHSQLISDAVQDAMDTSMMVHKFPFFVLYLEMDPYLIDVNVHPNKIEVKFRDEERVIEAIRQAVKSLPESAADFFSQTELEEKRIKPSVTVHTPVPVEEPEPAWPKQSEQARQLSEFISFTQEPSQEIRLADAPSAIIENIIGNKPDYVRKDWTVEAYTPPAEPVAPTVKEKPVQTDMRLSKEMNIRIIGSLFSTYVVVQCDDEAYIIDQHAAHERLLYERFMAKDADTSAQALLLPFMYEAGFTLAPQFEQIVPVLAQMGFEIEPFGHYSYQVRAIPAVLSGMDFNEFFRLISDILQQNKKLNKHDFIKEQLIMMSCKAAIKGGQPLSKEELEFLLAAVVGEEIPLTCPHGRPIMLRLSKTDIEKRFKRIQ